MQGNHQQDVIRICVLLFDNYKRLCLSSSTLLVQQADKNIYQIQLSRQSAKESILPGLITLKDIFQNKIISHQNTANELLQQIETMIQKIETMQLESPNLASTLTSQ